MLPSATIYHSSPQSIHHQTPHQVTQNTLVILSTPEQRHIFSPRSKHKHCQKLKVTARCSPVSVPLNHTITIQTLLLLYYYYYSSILDA